ncbi:type II secretion system F family protein [Polynucleobacter sp. 73C-SIWE]|uniref:type II secretion system F family protein n=1 Tax=Polynucleobacter sp. 73C-SIWE TaxID=2689098 RepID=UPI001C0AB571|nr:type II secretion system F family protein [Polynucleobacter sp. 73C-SIWE]MBU3578797.1 type II secretion system F family protein [Polynucleobacter sp. 73C-SIWE]
MAVNKLEQLTFAQQLLSLLTAGLPLLNAMELIRLSAPKYWQGCLSHLCGQLKQGESFSQALQAERNRFSAEFINLIRVSERTGNIELALQTICRQLESQIELRRKVQQALSYPAITLVSSLLLILVMMIWVVPVFKDVFAHFQAELPAPTKALIQLSTVIEHFFFEMAALLISTTGLFLFAWLKLPGLQKRCDELSFCIPILGQLFRLATLTHWCRTLGHLLDSGLALPDALRVTAQSSNHWLSHDLSAEIFKHLTRGWPLGDALIRADPKHVLFDIETWQLLRIASESGSLPQMLGKRANALGSQLSNLLNTLSQSLEPLLIIFVGIVIGSLVIILYLPIFNLGQIV